MQKNHRRHLVLLSLAATAMTAAWFALSPGSGGAAQIGGPSADASGPATSADDARAEVLRWFDDYLLRQVLFEKKDLLQLRAKIEQMSTGELAQWLEKTEQIRAELDSSEWTATEDWMREFLRVQALYSDEEIADFRAKAAKMKPGELHELLETIRQKHRSVRGLHQASVRARGAKLSARSAYLKQQAEARQNAARQTARSSHPLFGNTQSHAHRRAQSVKPYSKPLITSKEVARATVRRSVYRGYGWGW